MKPASFPELYWTLVELRPEIQPSYLTGEGLEGARELMAPLEPYRRRNGQSNPYPVQDVDLWDLYALSRVSDYLLLPFQITATPDSDLLPPSNELQPRFFDASGFLRRGLPKISEDLYLRFFETLGFARFEERTFSPFHHEIVEVDQVTDDSAEVTIVRPLWPGLKFGDMLFSRSGVRVRAPASKIRKTVAEQSTLYFAYLRHRRKTDDLSMGWGHNSQWRTDFRRDYEDNEHYYLNVDGHIDIGSFEVSPDADEVRRDLPPGARRELLIHRCFVTCTLRDHDRWPFDDTLTLRKGEATG
jgi:hypothetical protein